jgi:hypothetical protein
MAPVHRFLHRRPSVRPRTARSRRTRVVLVAACLAVTLSACGTPTVSLSELALEAEQYDGHDVVAHGVVQEFGAADGATERHFVIQDAEATRVRLLPDEAAEPHVGSAVTVTGEFEFDPERGRLLHVEDIERAGPTD